MGIGISLFYVRERIRARASVVDRKLNTPLLLSFASGRIGSQQRPEPGLLEVMVAGQVVLDHLRGVSFT
jgi:hypothetical protein